MCTKNHEFYVLNKKTDTKIAFSREFSTEKFQAWDQLDKEVDPMFINFIPDELFLTIRKELQKDKRTIDLTDIKISEIPDDIVSRRDMALRMWDGRHVFGDSLLTVSSDDVGITTLNNDSRSVNFSDDMVERIRRLIRNQPSQQLQPIRDEESNSQTTSNRPSVNYTSTFDDYVRQFMNNDLPYSDDLP